MRLLAVFIVFAVAVLLTSQSKPPETVGRQPDGRFLLVTGLSLSPAGRQVPLDTLPMSSALSPDGRFLLVLNGGYKPPTISVLDAASFKELRRVRVADGWLGLAFSPNGRLVYVGGGSQASVFEFRFSEKGELELNRALPVVAEAERAWEDFVGDVAVSPDGRLVYAAALYRNQILVINPQSGMVIERIRTGRRPYRILFQPDGKSFFVSSWADAAILQHKAESGEQMGATRVGPHPTDMVWRDRKTSLEEGEEFPFKARLFVASAYTNSVFVLGVSENNTLRQIESINVSLTPRQPAGMTPSALALNEDQSRLFVACSDMNTVAVADVSESRSRVLGFIPTGWYPAAVRVMPGGGLVILNSRGGGSHANPAGPQPNKAVARSHEGIRSDQYVGVIQTGSASVIDKYTDAQLERWTRQVMANTPYRDAMLEPSHSPSPVWTRAQDQEPLIRHVIYIVKENRTYDQVLGDLGKGNGDPSLCLFPENISPNHHKLAREFVLLDNFYVNGDVSADGHAWTTAAIAPDYTQKLWPNSYAARRRNHDYDASDPASFPPAGYIWTNALAAGLSVRNYGYTVNNKPKASDGGPQLDGVRDPALIPHTNMNYRGFDLDYPDIERAKVFIADLARMERDGKVPRFMVLRLGNDHTSGTSAGKISPLSAMADNDLALGIIVEAVSRSAIWPRTAIFVLEDDAQNGPDHVDSHRSPAYVISPYARRGAIDSGIYNTTSMLRTIELILGLRPMTTFDAGARPMQAAFQARADTRPYNAGKARYSLEERNGEAAPGAARSARMNFEEADLIDDDELNDILWRAIRGTEPPAPARSYFSN